jgi:hypothetical protein
MKLPNGDRAIIDSRKLRGYCLSDEHDEGRHKSRLFFEILGLSPKDSPQLIAALREAVARREAVPDRADQYGQRYVIDFEMAGPTRVATVRSAWIVRTHETVPRLVTCYIM